MAKHPATLLEIEDLYSVMMMVESESENDATTDGNEVMWLELEDQPDKSDLVLMCISDLKEVEVSLANNAFMHGHYSFISTTPSRVTLTSGASTKFNGVIIDTVANRRPIMSINQYRSYE